MKDEAFERLMAGLRADLKSGKAHKDIVEPDDSNWIGVLGPDIPKITMETNYLYGKDPFEIEWHDDKSKNESPQKLPRKES